MPSIPSHQENFLNTDPTQCWQEQLECLYTADGNAKWHSTDNLLEMNNFRPHFIPGKSESDFLFSLTFIFYWGIVN